MSEQTGRLFSDEVLGSMEEENIFNQHNEGPVTVLGITFNNDDERRAYFRDELRKKLPDLKQIEGFPIGTDDDIINLSDPPYYTACPNPWLKDFVSEWTSRKEDLMRSGERHQNFSVCEPYANDVSEGKYNDIYYKHPYHTKVPIAAIEQYLDHYTQPGDIIFDGFAGTGMTAVAGQLIKRKLKSITLDLSPIASYINYYYNYSIPHNELIAFQRENLNRIEKEYSWLYETRHSNGELGVISSIIWSDVFVCPHCNNDVVFWEDGVDVENGKVLPDIICHHCGGKFRKNNEYRRFSTYYDKGINSNARKTDIVPIRISYTYQGKSYYKVPDACDLELINRIEQYDIPVWYPNYPIPDGEKTPDAIKTGIKNVHQLYFKRTLIVFSELYNSIHDPRLLGILTSIAFRINKRYALTYMAGKWGAGGGPTNGTYYIPSLIKELNAFDVIASSIRKCANGAFSPDNCCVISTQSTTDLGIPDNTIDYIFTDPPFGGNLMYSELNFVWESWLKVFTNKDKESITSVFQDKGVDSYHNLMLSAFREYYRILKPGKWLSVEFSNTKAAIWNILQTSLQQAGFVISNVSALDKQKGSFNAQTSVTAVKQDLIITCYKPISSIDSNSDVSTSVDSVWDFVEDLLSHLSVYSSKSGKTTTVIERTPRIIYDKVISYFVQRGFPVPMDAIHFQVGLRERFIERDGMFFTPRQVAEYDEKRRLAPDFISLGLIVSNEAGGIEWLKNKLQNKSLTYQDIQPEWMQAINGVRKNDIIPELKQLLDENFIQDPDGKWRCPNIQDDKDVNMLRTKSLLREFSIYVEAADKPKARIKEARVEALRAGFKDCYIHKDFVTILRVGERIPQNLLSEDEVLLQFYDIASTKVG